MESRVSSCAERSGSIRICGSWSLAQEFNWRRGDLYPTSTDMDHPIQARIILFWRIIRWSDCDLWFAAVHARRPNYGKVGRHNFDSFVSLILQEIIWQSRRKWTETWLTITMTFYTWLALFHCRPIGELGHYSRALIRGVQLCRKHQNGNRLYVPW